MRKTVSGGSAIVGSIKLIVEVNERGEIEKLRLFHVLSRDIRGGRHHERLRKTHHHRLG
jgi:hypothetical protein